MQNNMQTIGRFFFSHMHISLVLNNLMLIILYSGKSRGGPTPLKQGALAILGPDYD